MTLLGKIFTMLIFIMALVWMSFAVAVYMTQKNWKDYATRPRSEASADKPVGLKFQLEDLETANERLREEKRALEDELHQERAARGHALAALEEARQAELALRKAAEATHTELLVAHREAAAAMSATQTRLDALKDEIAQARLDIKTAEQDRDEKLERVSALTDQLHQAEDTRRRLQERQSGLVAQIGRMKAVLDRHGLNEHTPLDGIPPKLDGIVLDVKEKFMEISLGSDDGLREGHQLEVFQGRTYKGRVVVRRVDPDRAVAEIIPELRKGEIQKGDRVITRTKLS